jgi:putative ABC transport system substrate-binding protein
LHVFEFVNDPNAERFIGDLQEAAHAKGLQHHILRASTESEIDGIFASLVELHAGALVVSPNAFFGSRRVQLVTLASRYAVPAIYTSREDPSAGGLISYGASLTSVFRQLGSYAGARGSAGSAADAVRAGRQPQGCAGARPHRAAIDPRPRR